MQLHVKDGVAVKFSLRQAPIGFPDGKVVLTPKDAAISTEMVLPYVFVGDDAAISTTTQEEVLSAFTETLREEGWVYVPAKVTFSA